MTYPSSTRTTEKNRTMPLSLSRRDVIKTLFVTSAVSLINNKLWAAKIVTEVKANAINPNIGIARLQLSSFTNLANVGGSVRLGSSSLVGDLPRGAFWPIIINRTSATEFVTVDSACLHEGAVIGRYIGTIPTGRMTCPRHQAQYEISGVCTRNPTSAAGFVGQRLRTYPTTLSNGILTIELADQGFSFTQQQVLNANEKRLALTWDALDLVEYEIRFRPDFATEPVLVNSSLTLSGGFTSTFVPGLTNGGTRTVYVQPQDGYFQVAIRTRTV